MSKIDITSTALEKGIDLAKDFLDKLITPSVEETGLLLRDKVTMWKFKNQVRMLNKVRTIVKSKRLTLKLSSQYYQITFGVLERVDSSQSCNEK